MENILERYRNSLTVFEREDIEHYYFHRRRIDGILFNDMNQLSDMHIHYKILNILRGERYYKKSSLSFNVINNIGMIGHYLAEIHYRLYENKL